MLYNIYIRCLLGCFIAPVHFSENTLMYCNTAIRHSSWACSGTLLSANSMALSMGWIPADALLITGDKALFGGGGAVITWPIFIARSFSPSLCSIKDLLTSFAFCIFLVAKKSGGGTLRLVLMLDKVFGVCATVVLLPGTEIIIGGCIAAGSVAEGSAAWANAVGGSVIDDVAEVSVAENGEKESSDISVKLSSVSENAVKKML